PDGFDTVYVLSGQAWYHAGPGDRGVYDIPIGNVNGDTISLFPSYGTGTVPLQAFTAWAAGQNFSGGYAGAGQAVGAFLRRPSASGEPPVDTRPGEPTRMTVGLFFSAVGEGISEGWDDFRAGVREAGENFVDAITHPGRTLQQIGGLLDRLDKDPIGTL